MELKSDKTIQNVLGLVWNTDTDCLFIKQNFEELPTGKVTKRILLSVYGSVYDVLGFWSPALISLKVLIQKNWNETKEWDNELGEEDKKLFLVILKDIQMIPTFTIPRLMCDITNETRFKLHAFSDAYHAYSAVVYLRCVNPGNVTSNLVFSKVRIAPKDKDKPSLPRLELLGVLIAFRSPLFVSKSCS